MGSDRRRPVIGVLCCNENHDRAVQVVASRFVDPLSRLSDATALLVPAISHAADIGGVAAVLDGLLLTGSRSHVAPWHYGCTDDDRAMPLDHERDEVALGLTGRMIEAGKPVFDICRGLQEINVLFGGSLSVDHIRERHHLGRSPTGYAGLFELRHELELVENGVLAMATGARRLTVNSVHEQAIARLGGGPRIEALSAEDAIVEVAAARPCGADVLAVRWHPEWDVASSAASRRFFSLVGDSLRASRA